MNKEQRGKLSLRWKIASVGLITAVFAMLLSFGIFNVLELWTHREGISSNVQSLSAFVVKKSIRALEENDKAAAGEALEILKTNNQIVEGEIQTSDGSFLASFNVENNEDEGSTGLWSRGYVFFHTQEFFNLDFRFPVKSEGREIGFLTVRAHLSELEQRLVASFWIGIYSFSFIALMSILITASVQKWIMKPIVKLIRTARAPLYQQGILYPKDFHNLGEMAQLEKLFDGVLLQAEELLDKNRYLDSVVSALSETMIVIDLEGKIEIINEVGAKQLGYAKEELIGKSIKKILKKDSDWKEVVSLECIITTGQVADKEISLFSKEGETIPTTLSGSAIFHENRLAGMIFLAYDLRQRISLEKQLAQAQKLEAVGQLAAGVAHEINTPMQYIGDNTEFVGDCLGQIVPLLEKYDVLLKKCREDGFPHKELLEAVEEHKEEMDIEFVLEEIPKAIAQAKEGVAHVVKIVKSLKAFSHPGGKEVALVDLNKAIENTVIVSRNEWKYVSELETELDPDLEMVPCHARELNQVFLNLIVNAAHAIEDIVGNEGEKGKIKVSTHQREEFAEIRITDSGGGIPKEVQAKIFDPFFTTKGVGKGTGQGLAIAHKIIVSQHKGNLTFETGGQGTTFIISLPMVLEEEEEAFEEEEVE